MAAAVLAKAVNGVVRAFDLETYGVMVSRSLRSAKHVHGIFSFAETNQADISRRYSGLTEAVSLARMR
jgi:hypothetical protein